MTAMVARPRSDGKRQRRASCRADLARLAHLSQQRATLELKGCVDGKCLQGNRVVTDRDGRKRLLAVAFI
jgi:hypothetical protein